MTRKLFRRFILPCVACPPACAAIHGTCWLVVLCIACSPATAWAQAGPPLVISTEFQRVPEPHVNVTFPLNLTPKPEAAEGEELVQTDPPKIDGNLTDACWRRALPLTLGADMPGGKVSRQTLVRLCRDEANLYVAFECREPAIDDYAHRRPAKETWTPENVQVWLQPSPSAERLFLFATGPSAARYDWRLSEGASWSGEWQTQSVRTPETWRAEMAIPLSTLGVNAIQPGALWRANFRRDVAATGERCSWQPTKATPGNPSQWGHIFFGDLEQYSARNTGPRLKAYPERYILQNNQRTLRVVVRLHPGKMNIAEARLRLRLTQKEIAVVEAEEEAKEKDAGGEDAEGDNKPSESENTKVIAPLEGNRVALVLNADRMPVKRSYVTVDLLDAEGGRLARTSFPLDKRETKPAPPVAGPGRLYVAVPSLPVKAATARQWPITTGVALPQAALFSAARTRLLNPAGREIPLQTTVRARWPDGSIQWLGLDFRANVAAGKGGRHTLEYGANVKRKPVRGFIRKYQHLPFDVANESYSINTGKLLFTVNFERFTGIEEASVDVDGNGRYDWTELILTGSRGGVGPYLRDVEGNFYAFAPRHGAQVVLEEWNELRLVLRGEGQLVLTERAPRQPGKKYTAPPMQMGRCIVRITAYAGESFLRLQYTFVFTKHAANSVLSDIGVREKFDFGTRYRAAFGVPGGYNKSLRTTGDVFLMWLAQNRCLLQTRKSPAQHDLAGNQAGNWVCAHGGNRGMVVCLRDMRHLFPKSFELRTDSRFFIHFWPPHGTADLRKMSEDVNQRTVGGLGFAHFGRFFDLRVPAPFSHSLKDRSGLWDFDAVKDMNLSDPTGIAPTYEMLYYLYSGEIDLKEADEVVRTFNLGPHALQDRQSLARAGVLHGMLSPARAKRAIAIAGRLLAWEQRFPEEGDFNYMDLHRKWLKVEDRWALRRRWVSTASDLPGALWLLYLQTGDPTVYRTARRNLRHVISMDFCHAATDDQTRQADPRQRKIAGAFADARTPVHWQSACHVNNRFARLRAPILAYYLTGDHSAREAALLWGNATQTCGVPTDGQDGAVFLENLWMLLQLEYDPGTLELLGETAEFFASRPCRLPGIETWGNGLRRYVAARGDPRIWRPLENLSKAPAQLEAAKNQFRLIGLLRDLRVAMGDTSYDEDADLSLALFEDTLKEVLAAEKPDPDRLSWDDFCAYIFGAARPIKDAGGEADR